MKNRIAKERVIYDNYDLWENHAEAAKEILEENGEEDDEISEEDIWNEIYFQDELWFNDEYSQLEEFFSDGKYILFGNIGRWDGINRGWEEFDDFGKLFSFATKDCCYVKIYDQNGHFCITCSHHDGTCHFEVKKLTESGIRYLENWQYNWNDKRSNSYIIDKLVRKYSVLPRYAEKRWGCSKVDYEPLTKESAQRELNNQARSFYC